MNVIIFSLNFSFIKPNFFIERVKCIIYINFLRRGISEAIIFFVSLHNCIFSILQEMDAHRGCIMFCVLSTMKLNII